MYLSLTNGKACGLPRIYVRGKGRELVPGPAAPPIASGGHTAGPESRRVISVSITAGKQRPVHSRRRHTEGRIDHHTLQLLPASRVWARPRRPCTDAQLNCPGVLSSCPSLAQSWPVPRCKLLGPSAGPLRAGPLCLLGRSVASAFPRCFPPGCNALPSPCHPSKFFTRGSRWQILHENVINTASLQRFLHLPEFQCVFYSSARSPSKEPSSLSRAETPQRKGTCTSLHL